MKQRKKMSLLITLFMFFLVLFPITAWADETGADYDSNGQVGFYGRYEFPAKPTPPDAKKPELIVTKPNGHLPQTDQVSTSVIAKTAGMTLILLASGIWIIQIKNKALKMKTM